MHEGFLEVLLRWSLVGGCAKSGHPLVIDKSLNWVESSHNDIDAKVKFDPIDQQGSINIPLQDYILVLEIIRYVAQLLEKANISALTSTLRLHYVSCLWISLLILLKPGQVSITWELPGRRNEIIVILVNIRAKFHYSSENVLVT